MNTATETWRNITYFVLDGQDDTHPASRTVSRFIITLIIANGIAVMLESNPKIHYQYAHLFAAFEVFSVIVFTVEYLARLWAATEFPKYAGMNPILARIRWIFRPMPIVDLLAILPFYMSLVVPIDLRYLRLFRLLRLLKLSHHFDGLEVFAIVLRREAGAIAGALTIMMIITIVSACLMFTVENSAAPGHFESVSQAIWWAVVTLTTVGYGDITPITFPGKLLGIAIMILGVGTMALPAGILAARFSEELRTRRELIQGKVRDALIDGVLDAAELHELERLQHELGLSADELQRIIAVQQRLLARHHYCPHCGEALTGSD